MTKALELLALAKTLAKDTQQSASFIRLLDMIEAEVSIKDAPANPFVIPGKTQVSAQDEEDPRAMNCRFHSPENEAVTGVWLTYHKNSNAAYRLKSVRLIDETNAGGRHFITVVQPGGLNVALGVGYGGDPDKFDSVLMHSPGQDLIIDGHGEPPNLGPYAVWLVDAQGRKCSDTIASFMLPRGHHVCFTCVFEKR